MDKNTRVDVNDLYERTQNLGTVMASKDSTESDCLVAAQAVVSNTKTMISEITARKDYMTAILYGGSYVRS